MSLTKSIRRALVCALTALPLIHGVPAVWAQSYPGKPIRIVVPFAAGGGSDNVARVVAPKLSESWKVAVVIDNRPGAGGAIGAELVATSPADGYTLLLSDSSAVTMNPFLYPTLPYQAKDLVPVINLATFALVLLVPPDSPAKSVRDLVAMDKAKPGSLNAASSGNGTSPHLTLEMMNSIVGTRIAHVPYKGGGPAFVDIMAGRVDMFFSGLSLSSMPLINAGKLKALAVTTATRVPSAPTIPTIAESGYPGFEAISAQTLFAPAGTPPEIVRRLNAELTRILRTPEVAERWAQSAYLPVQDQSPSQLAAWFARESDKWGKLIREQNIKID
jgi:tripartite-type tricarboxylate transporter receptor subunit TctC